MASRQDLLGFQKAGGRHPGCTIPATNSSGVSVHKIDYRYEVPDKGLVIDVT